MSAVTKKTQSAAYVSRSASLLRCPVCTSSVQVVDHASLVCSGRHTFDFAKQGYINLLTHPLKTKYDKKLFTARRNLIIESGLFTPLTRTVAEMIIHHRQHDQAITRMLDAGCGEGSHLVTVCDQVSAHFAQPITGVGIDIAKEGIAIAASHYPGRIWCVADLANVPCKDEQFDVILTMLSPSNYAECSRLLRHDGMIVKVLPQSGYAKELREALYDEPKKRTYSNAATVARFENCFETVDTFRLCYTMPIDKPMLASLLYMTPLTWTAAEEKIQAFLEKSTFRMTIDVDILVGRKRNSRI